MHETKKFIVRLCSVEPSRVIVCIVAKYRITIEIAQWALGDKTECVTFCPWIHKVTAVVKCIHRAIEWINRRRPSDSIPIITPSLWWIE